MVKINVLTKDYMWRHSSVARHTVHTVVSMVQIRLPLPSFYTHYQAAKTPPFTAVTGFESLWVTTRCAHTSWRAPALQAGVIGSSLLCSPKTHNMYLLCVLFLYFDYISTTVIKWKQHEPYVRKCKRLFGYNFKILFYRTCCIMFINMCCE